MTSINAVELHNGIRLPYVEQGSRSGIPVLLLHGYSDFWRSFEPVLPHLPAAVRALALTLRGHGDADRPADGYHPHDFAADVATFMDALDIRRAVIVGHSMGSYIAQRFAMDHPTRTTGLMLVGSCTSLRGNPGVAELRDAVAQLVDPIDPDFVRAFQVSTLAQPVPPAFMDAIVQESLKVPARVWQAVLDALAEADFSAELDKISTPTRIVWGDQDAFFGRGEQDALAAAIPDARLIVYRGAGHGLHWEEPERFARDLQDFAEEVG